MAEASVTVTQLSVQGAATPEGGSLSGSQVQVVASLGLPGPAGPQGASGGEPTRTDFTGAATWTLTHSLGRVPTVQVFLAGGEQVAADVVATTTQVNVSFAAAATGFVIVA